MSERPAHRPVAELAAYFVGDLDVAEALTNVCRAVVDAVAPARLAGVAMIVDGHIGTHVFSHPTDPELAVPHEAVGDGPDVDACLSNLVISIVSTEADGPYEAFRRAALEQGYRSTLSIPMDAGTLVVGALNLYADREGAFEDGETIAAVSSYATQAAFVLLNHQAYWDVRTLNDNLTTALESRAVIEQAKGIIMSLVHCSPDEAFERLRAQSQHENVKLRQLALELVARTARRR